MAVPALLSSLLVVISFFWNVHKSVYLYVVLKNTLSYHTHVDIVVLTNRPAPLARTLKSWGLTQVRVVRPDMSSLDPGDKYALLWSYHSFMKQSLEHSKKTYTSFLYLEDDTFLSWPALVSWAKDTELLEPLNFTRGIFRTEINPDLGELVLADISWTTNITTHTMKLDAATQATELYNKTRIKYPNSDCLHAEDAPNQPCGVHRYYVQFDQPFQGMWIASRSQLQRYVQHPLWQRDAALKATDTPQLFNSERTVNLLKVWGYPERTNGMVLVMDVPDGFVTNNVVPYDVLPNGTAQLSRLAHVRHLRNGYSTAANNRLGKLLVNDALVV